MLGHRRRCARCCSRPARRPVGVGGADSPAPPPLQGAKAQPGLGRWRMLMVPKPHLAGLPDFYFPLVSHLQAAHSTVNARRPAHFLLLSPSHGFPSSRSCKPPAPLPVQTLKKSPRVSSCPDFNHLQGSDDSNTLFCSPPRQQGASSRSPSLHVCPCSSLPEAGSEPSAQSFKLEVEGAVIRDVFLLSLTRGKGRPCRVYFQNSQGPCFHCRGSGLGPCPVSLRR